MKPTDAPQSRDRRGVALPLALFSLVIAAVMITAVFYVGRLEQRMGYNSLASTQAFEAAEAGIAAVLSDWVSSTYNSMATGAVISLPSTSVGGNAVYTASVRRVNTTLFLVQAEGRYLVAGNAITRRQVARLVRFDPPDLDPLAAVASRLTLEVAGAADINGRDSVPPAWGAYCPPPGPTVPGIRDSVATITVTAPCTVLDCITGNPPVQVNDSAVTDAGFYSWGTLTFGQMAAMADKTISGSVGGLGPTTDPGPVCRTTDASNWGDPLDPGGPCGNYFPIIHAPGDVTLTGGVGQGILLVEGDLTVAGPVSFYGAVMVKGSVQASDGNLIGALTINSSTGSPATTIGGTATVTYSRCVLDRVASGAAPTAALHERSWIQLY
jgi:hypothetical protein